MRYICNECTNSCTLTSDSITTKIPNHCVFGPDKELLYDKFSDDPNSRFYVDVDKSKWRKVYE